MRLKNRIATTTSLLLVMITCLGSYATAGMGPSGKAAASVQVAELYRGPVFLLAATTKRSLANLVRPEQPMVQQAMPSPEDQLSCQESCAIRQVTSKLED